MAVDVIIDPLTGQIYWNDSQGTAQSIAISGNGTDIIKTVGYSLQFSASPSGFITTNSGSTIVSGSGTNFTSLFGSGAAGAGAVLYTAQGTSLGTVSTVSSDTGLTLSGNASSTFSGIAFRYTPPAGTDRVIFSDSSTPLYPATTGANLGSATYRWSLFASNGDITNSGPSSVNLVLDKSGIGTTESPALQFINTTSATTTAQASFAPWTEYRGKALNTSNTSSVDVRMRVGMAAIPGATPSSEFVIASSVDTGTASWYYPLTINSTTNDSVMYLNNGAFSIGKLLTNGTTSSYALEIYNYNLATSGAASQWSPAFEMNGSAWNSATASSNVLRFRSEVQMTPGNPITGVLMWKSAVVPSYASTPTFTNRMSLSDTNGLGLWNANTAVSYFKAGSQASDIRYTLPTGAPTANQVLAATSVSGADIALGWATAASGSGSGTVNSGTIGQLAYYIGSTTTASAPGMVYTGVVTDPLLALTSQAAGSIPLRLVGSAGQTASLFTVTTSAPATVFDINNAGTNIIIGAITGTTAIQNARFALQNVTQITANIAGLTLLAEPIVLTAFGGAVTSIILASGTNNTIGATTGTTAIRNATIAFTGASTITGNAGTMTIFPDPTSVTAFGAAATLNLGVNSGTAQILNPTVTLTNATNLNINGANPTVASTATGKLTLFNANITAVDAFQASTNNVIGATTGTTAIRNATLALTNLTTVTASTLGVTLLAEPIVLTAFGGAVTSIVLASGTNNTIGSTTGTTAIRNATIAFTGASTITGNAGTMTIFPDPTSVTAFGAAATLNLGVSSGTAQILNPTVTLTNATTLNINGANPTVASTATGKLTLFNANITSVDAFQASTNNVIGATTGTTVIRNATIAFPNVTSVTASPVGLTLLGEPIVLTAFGGAVTSTVLASSTNNTIGATTGTTAIRNATIAFTGASTITGNAGTMTIFPDPTSVTAFGAAATLNVGVNSGTAQILNPTVTLTNATNLNINGANPTVASTATGKLTLFNANITAVDAFQASTNNVIGAITGTTVIRNAALALPNITTITGGTVGLTILAEPIVLTAFGGAITSIVLASSTNNTIGATTGTTAIRNATIAYPNVTTITANTAGLTLFAQPIVLNAYGGAVTSTLLASGTNNTIGATTGTTAIRNATIAFTGASTITGNAGTMTIFPDPTSVTVFGAAATMTLGVNSGTAQILNPTVTLTNATTLNINGTNPTVASSSTGKLTLFNTNITAVDAFQASSNNVIGAITGTTAIQNARIAFPNVTQITGNTLGLTLLSEPIVLTAFGGAVTSIILAAGTNNTIGSTTGTTAIRNATIAFTGASTITGNAGTMTIFPDPTSVTAFGAAATMTLGVNSGTAQILNPTVTLTNATTLNINGANPTVASTATGKLTLFNANITAVDAFQASTNNVIGATTGTTAIRNANLALPSLTSVTASTLGVTLLAEPIVLTAFGGAVTSIVLASGTNNTIGSTTGTTAIRNATIAFAGASTITGNAGTMTIFPDPTSVTAFGAAATLNLGVNSGTAFILNPTVTLTNATTLNINGANPTVASTATGKLTLFNANITAVDAFQASTNNVIGSTTGTTVIRNANIVMLNASAFDLGSTVTAGSTYNFATGGNTTGAVKTINIGTNATASGLTAITLGSALGTSTLVINGVITSNVYLAPTGTGTNELRFFELAANGLNYTAIKAPDALASEIVYTLPSAAPVLNQSLTATAVTGSSVTLGWATASSGSGSVSAGTINQVAYYSGSVTTASAAQMVYNAAGTTLVITAANAAATPLKLVSVASQTSNFFSIENSAAATIFSVSPTNSGADAKLTIAGTASNQSDLFSITNGGSLTVAGGFAGGRGVRFNLRGSGNQNNDSSIFTITNGPGDLTPLVFSADGTTGYGLTINGALGGYPLSIKFPDDATNNTVKDVISVERTTSGAATSGIGARIAYRIEQFAGTSVLTSSIDGILTNTINATYTGALIFNTNTAGTNTLAERVRIDNTAVSLSPIGTAAGNTNELRFFELVASGSNYTAFKAPDSLASELVYTLPSTAPLANQILSATVVSGSSVTLGWATDNTGAGGSGTVGAGTINQVAYYSGSSTTASAAQMVYNAAGTTLVITAANAAATPLKLIGAGSQSSPLLTITTSTPATVFEINSAGTNNLIGAATGTTAIFNATVAFPNLTNMTTGTVGLTLFAEPIVLTAFGGAITSTILASSTNNTIGATTGTTAIRNATIAYPNVTTITANTAGLTLFAQPIVLTAFGGAVTSTVLAAGINNTIGSTTGTTAIRNATIAFTGASTITGNAGSMTIFPDPTSVTAFGAAATMNLGVNSGTAQILNPTVTLTNATNFNINGANPTVASTATGKLTLFNANITAVDAFQASTNNVIGATTGTTVIRNANIVMLNASALDLGSTITTGSTYNFATGGNTTGAVKTINIGTNATASGLTAITIGSTLGTSTLVINGNITSNVYLAPTGTGTNELRFFELAANGLNYTAFKAPDSLASELVYTLPSTAPIANQILAATAVTGSSVTLGWATDSTGAGGSGSVSAGTINQVAYYSGSTTTASAAQMVYNAAGTTLVITAANAAATPLKLIGAGSQSSPLITITTSTPATVFEINSAGANNLIGATTGTTAIFNANLALQNVTSVTGSTLGLTFLAEPIVLTAFGGAITSTVLASSTNNTIGATTGTTAIRNATVAYPNVTTITANTAGLTLFAQPIVLTAFGGAVTSTVLAAGTNNTIGATTGTTVIRNANVALSNATAFDVGSTVTAASAINIATGVNTTGAVKTINIGTNATVSGLTAITIGATTGTSTITLNGVTTLSTPLGIASGGTNAGSFANTNGVIFFNGTTLVPTNATASGILVTNASNTPSISTDIPTSVTIGSQYIYRQTGTDVALADGGTNASLVASGGSVVYSSATAMAFSGVGTTGQALLSGGSGAPTFGTLGMGAGGTGLTTTTPGGNYLLGVTPANNALEYKQLVAGANITITQTTASITITASGGSATPGGSPNQIQFNSGGALGGVPNFNFNGTSLSVTNTTNFTTTSTLGFELKYNTAAGTTTVNNNSPAMDFVGRIYAGAADNNARIREEIQTTAATPAHALVWSSSYDTGSPSFTKILSLHNVDGLGFWNYAGTPGTVANYFKTGSQATDVKYTWPTAAPTVNQVLQATSVSGANIALGWNTVAAGGGSGSVSTGTIGQVAYYLSSNTTASAAAMVYSASATHLTITSQAANVSPLKLQGAASQSAALFTISSSAADVFVVNSSGVISTGNWQATVIPVLYGGTGQSSYTDGQLLIGNSSGNTLTKANLTAGNGIAVANGNGSISVRTKRVLNIQLASGYNPPVGADSAIIRIPESATDGSTSLTYNVRNVWCRVENPSTGTSSFQVEYYSGTSAFSATNLLSNSILLTGATGYEFSTTGFSTATLTTGTKLRLNFSNVDSNHAYFSINLLLEEQ